MNKKQKQVQQSLLNDEKKVLQQLNGLYQKALVGIDEKIVKLLARQDANTPTVIYQVQHQQALKQQITGILDQLQGNQFNTIDDYLQACYTNGYTGAMYDISGQLKAPVVMAPDPQQVVKAVQLDSKISTDLYTALGKDIADLKKQISATISRGVSTGMSYHQLSGLLTKRTGIGYNNAARIVRTEGHRIQAQSAMDAGHAAKAQGADVLKQWNSTLDGRTRPAHAKVDGEIREMEEPFSNGLMFPGDPNGGAAQVINCRCALLQRARWALDDDELETLKKRAEFYGLDKTKDFDDFKAKYIDAVQPIPVKPKKEILTKKKLEEKLAAGKTQLADLEDQAKALSGGYTWEELVQHYGSLDKLKGKVDANKLKLFEDLHDQIEALKADMATWDDLLDKKLVSSKLKSLKKDQLMAQQALDAMDTSKVYHNIWKDDVTVLDYGAKQGSIAAKKAYFENKLLSSTGSMAEMQKWQDLLDDLDDFDKQGSAYWKAKTDLDKATAEWAKLKKSGTLKVDTSVGAAYTQDRKNAALWFDKAHGGFKAADAYFDPHAKKIHGAALPKERDGFYTYTQGSGGHNRPLAGFQKPWSKPGSGWEEQFYVGPKKVWIDFEGKGEQIRGLTSLIEKSVFDDDIWLQSGQEFRTIEGFLGIQYDTLGRMSDAELQQFVGRRNVVYNFFSTAVNEGGGSMFNAKPLKINFYAPKGSQMLYASDVGAFGKGENEMILQRGGTYEITKIYWGNDATDNNRRKIFVDMDIHPEAGYDTFQQDPNEWTGSRKNYRD